MKTDRVQLIHVVLALVRAGDLDILPKLVGREQLAVALELAELVRSFDYLASEAFLDMSRGKSPAFVEALRRRCSEPVKRAELERECHDHIGRILGDGEVERYFPARAAGRVASIRRKLEALDGP